MKYAPLVSLFAPLVWPYAAGLVAEPLAVALGSARPDLVASSLQFVTFVGSVTYAGWLASKSLPVQAQPEMTTSQMRRALEAGRAQEREYHTQQQYAAEVAAVNSGWRMDIGTRIYKFPNGIFPEHLIALGDVLVKQGKPTDRALVPPFKRGDGETYQAFRDWMIYHAGEKPGALASFASQKGDWNLTVEGRYVLLQWLYKLSHSPTEQAENAKKAHLALSKATREQLSKGNEP